MIMPDFGTFLPDFARFSAGFAIFMRLTQFPIDFIQKMCYNESNEHDKGVSHEYA